MKSEFRILLVEDSKAFREAVAQLLGVYNDVDEAGDLASAKSALQKATYDVVILDKGLPDGDGIELISEIKATSPNTVVIILTTDSDFTSVKHCIARGADDYVIKSENCIPDLLIRIPVAVSKSASKRRLDNLEGLLKEAFRYEIVGKSVSTMELREAILSLKGTAANVLITGESGTGKELIARRLNAIEDDGKRPFVAINCGAIAENLIESELFGHKKGSFTGATQDRAGRFELADNGDLFLDEIGELPLAAQVKLLRAIQEGEITRVGDSRVIKVKCRVIAATNQSLEQMVEQKKFRDDLYHRLNVVRLSTTSLRERTEDIGDLAKLFTLQIGGANYSINDKAIQALQDYDWPGNIRELRNSIERAVIHAKRRSSTRIEFEDIVIQKPKEDVLYRMRKIQASLPHDLKDISYEKYAEFSETIEREYFKTVLELVGGDVLQLVDRIGISRSTVFKKISDLGIPIGNYKKEKPIKKSRKLESSPAFEKEVGGSI